MDALNMNGALLPCTLGIVAVGAVGRLLFWLLIERGKEKRKNDE